METAVHVKLFIILLFSVAQVCESGKIIGGKPAREGQFPYQVSVQCMEPTQTHLCGGVLYNHRTIITSGHCCTVMNNTCRLDQTRLVAGELDFNSVSGYEQISSLDRLLIHPQFSLEVSDGMIFYDNDICLMITGASLVMTSSVANQTLGETGDCKPGLKCSLAGWGSEEVGQEKPSDYLTYSEIGTIDDSSCQTAFHSFDQSHMICGGEVGVQISIGDGGGPLACDNKLCGIASFPYYGNDTAKLYYTFFTRVSSYLEWIIENSEDEFVASTTTTTTTTTPTTTTTTTTPTTTTNKSSHRVIISYFELFIVFAILIKTFYS